MVVGLALAAVQMGMALPTGFLFGVGYGTGVRIGYEQVYPLLFPKGARSTTSELAATMKGMNTVYDAIGGKDASRMGIAVGITNAGEILNNPDFRVLEQLESSSSGLTSSNLQATPSSVDSNSSLQVDPSFSSIPQKDSIFFSQPSITLQEKQFLINEINSINSITELMRRRNSYTDPNLIQVIEARIRHLRNPIQQPAPIVNTVPTQTVTHRAATSDEIEFNIWNNKLTILIQQILVFRNGMTQGGPDIRNASREKHSQWLSKLRKIAQDFRNPNNTIRNRVLQLRQELANNAFG